MSSNTTVFAASKKAGLLFYTCIFITNVSFGINQEGTSYSEFN